jgi:uncharacterized membrane protein
MATQEQLQKLKSLSGNMGGFDSTQFQDYVNTSQGAGSYDKLKSTLTAQDQAQKASVAPTAPVSAPVEPIEQEAVAPITRNVVAPVVTPEIETPITPKVKTTPTTQETSASPTSISEWKASGSNITDLETIIEGRYNTVINNEN